MIPRLTARLEPTLGISASALETAWARHARVHWVPDLAPAWGEWLEAPCTVDCLDDVAAELLRGPTPLADHPGVPRLDRRTGALAESELPTLHADARLARIDIIGFGELVNGPFGYEYGDQVLRIVAQRLIALAAPGRVFRVGGDDFLIEIVQPIDVAVAKELARRISAVLAQPIKRLLRGVPVRIGFSLDPVGNDWRRAAGKAAWAVHQGYLTRRSVTVPTWHEPVPPNRGHRSTRSERS